MGGGVGTAGGFGTVGGGGKRVSSVAVRSMATESSMCTDFRQSVILPFSSMNCSIDCSHASSHVTM